MLHAMLHGWLCRVFWGAHGSGHGQWVAWDKCLHTSDGLLRAFVSYKSHGFYPEPRTYWRAWGTINDVCGEARQWRPEAKDFTDASKQAWTQSHFQVRRGGACGCGCDTPPHTLHAGMHGMQPS